MTSPVLTLARPPAWTAPGDPLITCSPPSASPGAASCPARSSLLRLDAKHNKTASTTPTASIHADHTGNFHPCGNTFCQTATAALASTSAKTPHAAESAPMSTLDRTRPG